MLAAIDVQGFKSVRHNTRIDLRNLTVISGANSSGKSSLIQPLLLFKQTLDCDYDPGPLKTRRAEHQFHVPAGVPVRRQRTGGGGCN